MKIWLSKKGGGLFPCHNSDHEALKKIKIGKEYYCEIKQPRNGKFHRKFFALLNLVFQNQEIFQDFDECRYFIIMKCGYYKSVETPSGVMILPKSISFAKMTQTEFEELFEKALDKVQELFNFDKQMVMENLNEFY